MQGIHTHTQILASKPPAENQKLPRHVGRFGPQLLPTPHPQGTRALGSHDLTPLSRCQHRPQWLQHIGHRCGSKALAEQLGHSHLGSSRRKLPAANQQEPRRDSDQQEGCWQVGQRQFARTNNLLTCQALFHELATSWVACRCRNSRWFSLFDG